MGKPVVLFVCTHNSCRSQMAEALGSLLAPEVFISCSAGTHPARRVNPDAVRVMRQHYGVDMEECQSPKTLHQLPPVDYLITMGCGVQCPVLPCKSREDWGLADPTGQGDAAFLATAQEIERRIRALAARIAAGT